MAKKPVTLNHLKRKIWWWQWRDIRRYGVVGVVWDKHTKDAARNYELMRRSSGGKHFPKSYLELNSDERAFLHVLWGDLPTGVIRFATNKGHYAEHGWTPVLPNPPIQWNIRLPDTVLISEFQRQIAIARVGQGISVRRHPLTGNKHRSGSWNFVEILDRQMHGLGPFNPSERHTATEGRRKAHTLLRQFKTSLKQALESSRSDLFAFADDGELIGRAEFFNSE